MTDDGVVAQNRSFGLAQVVHPHADQQAGDQQ